MDGELWNDAPPHTDADAPDDIPRSSNWAFDRDYTTAPTIGGPQDFVAQPEPERKQWGTVKTFGLLFLFIAIPVLSLKLVVAVAHATFPANEEPNDVPPVTYTPGYGFCAMNPDKCPADVATDLYDLGNAEVYGP